jgi:hypothetical protein
MLHDLLMMGLYAEGFQEWQSMNKENKHNFSTKQDIQNKCNLIWPALQSVKHPGGFCYNIFANNQIC